MFKKEFSRGNMPKMNLQFFAEPADPAEPEDPGDPAESEEPDPADNQKPGKTFTQAEVNAILAKEKAKLQKATEEKITEAEKLAKMTAEQKAQYEANKKAKEIKERETAVTKRELMAEAKVTLAEKGLPVSLGEVLNYTDADTCKESIETVSKAFEEAVKAGVADRLKGGKPPKKATNSNPDDGMGASAFVDIIKENQSKR